MKISQRHEKITCGVCAKVLQELGGFCSPILSTTLLLRHIIDPWIYVVHRNVHGSGICHGFLKLWCILCYNFHHINYYPS